MSLKGEVDGLYNALVESGAIRIVGLPVAEVPIADDAAWDQLFAAAGAPSATAPCWLIGIAYNFATTTVAAEHTLLFDVGYGGVDGAAVAAATVLLTNFPVTLYGVAAGLGPMGPLCAMLPVPIRIPPAQRMAARIAASPVGGVATTSFRVILATGMQ
jgi:hypothetical protein